MAVVRMKKEGRGGHIGVALMFLLLISMMALWWVTSYRHTNQETPVIIVEQIIIDIKEQDGLKPSRNKLEGSNNVNKGVFHMKRETYTPLEGNTANKQAPQCDITKDQDRFDCYPGSGASAESCQARGCCWRTPSSKLENDVNIPYCYFPTNYPSYNVQSLKQTPQGYSLSLVRSQPSPWPKDISEILLDVTMEADNRLHFKFFDPKSSRYEVPIQLHKETQKSSLDSAAYNITFREKPFGMRITRKTTGAVIFDSIAAGAPLIFADQFLQLSTQLYSGLVYGLGEHYAPLLLNTTAGWSQLTFWPRDIPPSVPGGTNLYGVHPFYLELEPEHSNAHGLLLLNSNAMDVELQPTPALTYRTIGGVLDFYLFMGPSPDEVVQQYVSLIGLPYLPPYWSLGFHLCRYGYGSSDKLKKVIARNRALGIPYEAQWTDIDYMDQRLDWTYDHKNFADLPAVVNDLHEHDQHYVIIVDPAIGSAYPGKYPPYDEGVKRGIFIKNATGQLLVGKVWPGNTVFPDWSNPDVVDWWYDSAKTFHDLIPFDGLWNDMNEPSNFVDGSLEGCTSTSPLDNPPFTPGVLGGKLQAKTLCGSAQQHLGSHYNLHSLYGLMETSASLQVLEKLRPMKRGFVLTRSSFVGSGQYTAHWTGDIPASWDSLYYTVPEMMAFQMFGVPMVGADICGFVGPTNEQLCTRWMQLGAFYPFMRNHNDDTSPDQDPGVFSPTAQQIMKSALELRYSLLPTLYTLLVQSHINGSPVVRPLFFQYPEDPVTFGIDRQFLWGNMLLISPVVEKDATSVKAYFPRDTWYDYYTGEPLESSGEWRTLDAPMDKINLHVRGGSIFITQQIEVTTVKARMKPFGMVIPLDGEDVSGNLFWDDGDTQRTVEDGKYTWISMVVDTKENILICVPKKTGYQPEGGMILDHIRMLGVLARPGHVRFTSSGYANFTYNPQTKVLLIPNLSEDLLSGFQMEWV